MQEYQYPDYIRHMGAHARFIADLEILKQEIDAGIHRGLYLYFRLESLLVDWVVEHISVVDRQFGLYIVKRDKQKEEVKDDI